MLRTTIVLCLAIVMSGCTVTMQDPSSETKQEQTEVLLERIEAYKLLEEEAKLIYSLTRLKADTAKINAPPAIASPE